MAKILIEAEFDTETNEGHLTIGDKRTDLKEMSFSWARPTGDLWDEMDLHKDGLKNSKPGTVVTVKFSGKIR